MEENDNIKYLKELRKEKKLNALLCSIGLGYYEKWLDEPDSASDPIYLSINKEVLHAYAYNKYDYVYGRREFAASKIDLNDYEIFYMANMNGKPVDYKEMEKHFVKLMQLHFGQQYLKDYLIYNRQKDNHDEDNYDSDENMLQ